MVTFSGLGAAWTGVGPNHSNAAKRLPMIRQAFCRSVGSAEVEVQWRAGVRRPKTKSPILSEAYSLIYAHNANCRIEMSGKDF